MTFHPATAASRTISGPRTEGLIARMLRLWVEHHQRMLDCGMRPF